MNHGHLPAQQKPPYAEPPVRDPEPQPPASQGPLPPESLWRTIDDLHDWLGRNQTLPPGETVLLRVLKLAEEVGEAAQAVIGAKGQNPRKGTSHRWSDVEAELCDVAITALVALRTLTPEARGVFEGHLARVAKRSLGNELPGEGG